jgi:hypothetical protein
MTRYETMVVLIKVVGIYTAIEGLATLVQAMWLIHDLGKAVTNLTQQSGYSFSSPIIHLALSPALIYGAPVLARVCGEWPQRSESQTR